MKYHFVLLLLELFTYCCHVLCYCNDSKNNKYCTSLADDEKVKFFDVSVTSAPEVETFSFIREHIRIIRQYIELPDELNSTFLIPYNDTSYNIEDEILFMESFISSFSSQSNITTPFSTNGVTISTVSDEVINCKSNNLFDVSNIEMGESIRNHLITKVIPEFDNINKTIAVVPWDMVNNTVSTVISEIQRMSYKFTLICTAISNNIDLIKYYSGNEDVKKSQWEALQMASLSRGYSRYVLETLSLAASLVLISPNSKDDFTFISEMGVSLSLEYPKKLIEKLRYGDIQMKDDFNCIDFFKDTNLKETHVLCSTLFLTLFSRLQCHFMETGISREAILGIRWIEDIKSHIIQLYNFVLSIWNGYYYKLYENSSHYIPPKPYISWKAIKLKLYDQFRIIINLHNKIEQSSTLDLHINSSFSRKERKDTEINNYIELKIMDSISGLDELREDELELIEKITNTYNSIVTTSEYSPKNIFLGSNNKLSNSLNAVSLIIGTFVDDEFINSAIENIRETKYELLIKDCNKLHREIDHIYSQPLKFIEVYNKYLFCKYKFDIQLSYQFSLKNKFEIIKRVMRKITISSRNLLFDRLRERKNNIKSRRSSGFNISFTKILSQFQIILGMAKIIKARLKSVSKNISGLIHEVEYCILSLEKYKMKLTSHIFNTEYYYRNKKIDKDRNNINYLISPITTSLGSSVVESTGNNLKKTINELRYKISLLDKFVTLSRNTLLVKSIFQNSTKNQNKNLLVYSTALRIYDNKDELYVASEFIKMVYITLKKVATTVTEPLNFNSSETDADFIDFGVDGSCNTKHEIFSLKNSEHLGCRLFVKMLDMIKIDELYTLIQRHIITTDNTERKIYYEISGLFDEMWPDFEVISNKQSFKRLSSKLYLLKSLLENIVIFNGISKNLLVPYTNGVNNYSCLFDFLVGNIKAIENAAKKVPIIYEKNPRVIFKRIGSYIKGLFVKKERVMRRKRKKIEKDIRKLAKILMSLEPYVINIDISFKVNIENLNFIRIGTRNRIKKLFNQYIHCIYSTLSKAITTGTVSSKHFPLEVGNEWNDFIQQLEVVKNLMLSQLSEVLVSLFIYQ